MIPDERRLQRAAKLPQHIGPPVVRRPEVIRLTEPAGAGGAGDARVSDGHGAAGINEAKSQATQLVAMVIETGVLLFHDQDFNAYAKFPVGEHHEVARIGSGSFKRWLARLFHENAGKVV